MLLTHEESVQRINGKLHSITAITDETGKVIKHQVNELKVELTLTDVMQILVGAGMLAIPTALTQEVWDMGREVPWLNVLVMLLIEYIVIGMFIYLQSYNHHITLYKSQYIKRVLTILIMSGMIVGLFLALVGQLPLFTETDVAIKRIIIGILPASMSATVMDSLK